MSAPFRITRRERGLNLDKEQTVSQENFKDYLDRLLKMVPGEVIGLYLVGSGFIPPDQMIGLLVWSIICLVAVVVIRAFGTADPKQKIAPSWMQVGISSIAFVLWVYSMGGVFKSFQIHVPYIGSLMVLAWSFFVPFFYKGALNKE